MPCLRFFSEFKRKYTGVPIVAQWLTNLRTTRFQVRSLALLGGLKIRHCSELWCGSQTQHGSCIVGRCRPVATAPIRPLAWKPPYAAESAQEMAKRQKRKKRKKIYSNPTHQPKVHPASHSLPLCPHLITYWIPVSSHHSFGYIQL